MPFEVRSAKQLSNERNTVIDRNLVVQPAKDISDGSLLESRWRKNWKGANRRQIETFGDRAVSKSMDMCCHQGELSQ